MTQLKSTTEALMLTRKTSSKFFLATIPLLVPYLGPTKSPEFSFSTLITVVAASFALPGLHQDGSIWTSLIPLFRR